MLTLYILLLLSLFSLWFLLFTKNWSIFKGQFKTITSLFFFGLLLTLYKGGVQAQVIGKDYYVSPNGNNSNSGELSSPWKTLDYAFNYSGLKAGDTVYIRNGIYEEGIININNNPHGQKDSLITYKNYPNEQPVLKGTALIFKDKSYIRVEGLKFTNLFQTTLAAKSLNKQISGIQFVNNTFENNTRTPDLTFIRVSTACTIDCTSTVYQRVTDVLIEGNTLLDDKTNLVVNGVTLDDASDALQVEGNVDFAKILNNTLVNTRSIAIAIAGRTWKNNDELFTPATDDPHMDQMDYLVIKGNKVVDSNGTAIYLDAAGDNFIIEDNILTNNEIGIKVAGEPVVSTLDSKNGIVRRNLVVNNLMSFAIGSSITTGKIAATACNQVIGIDSVAVVHNTFYSDKMSSVDVRFNCTENLRFKNNIVVDTMGTSDKNRMYQAPLAYSDDSSWEIDGNILFSGTFPKQFRWTNNTYNNLSEFKLATGHDTTSKDIDPLFNNIVETDFSLAANSPAVDTALPLTVTSTSGSGTTLILQDVRYFSNGEGLIAGDKIVVGTNPAVQVVSINRNTNTLEVSTPISWSIGDKVYYAFAGASSDIGAYEFGTFPNDSSEEEPPIPNCTEDCPSTVETEFVLPVIADASISSYLPSLNYGKKKHMQVIKTTRSAIFKFDIAKLQGKTIESAYLQYTIGKYPLNGTKNTYKIRSLGSTWDEYKVNYNNVPIYGEILASVYGSAPSEVVEVDITAYLMGNVENYVSFALTDVDGPDNLIVESKETTTPAKLVVTVSE